MGNGGPVREIRDILRETLSSGDVRGFIQGVGEARQTLTQTATATAQANREALAPPSDSDPGLPPGSKRLDEQTAVSPDGFLYFLSGDRWVTEGMSVTSAVYERLFPELAGVGAGDGSGTALARLAEDARQFDLSLGQRQEEFGETQRANLAQEELGERNVERQVLSDKFERASLVFESAQLAESLAREKRLTAATTLRDMVEFLVPPGMEFFPGFGPGSMAEGSLPPGAGRVNRLGSIDLGQFTQPSADVDAAVQYLQSLEQQGASF